MSEENERGETTLSRISVNAKTRYSIALGEAINGESQPSVELSLFRSSPWLLGPISCSCGVTMMSFFFRVKAPSRAKSPPAFRRHRVHSTELVAFGAIFTSSFIIV